MAISLPGLLVTAALTGVNMALNMMRKIEGPRLDDLSVTSGDYGAALPMIWGTRRIQGQIFWAEPLREVKRRRKTKGGKYNEYTYFGTWAVAACGHQIQAITRIWFDTHLVYDVTGAGPVTPFDFGETNGRTIQDFIAIYLGTEDQEPDPRMQATVEAEHGAGSCPAYRGTAHVVFKDIPVEKLGNRIPQVSFEVTSSDSPAYPYENFTLGVNQPNRLWGATFSPDFSRFMWANGTDYEIWDVAARAQIVTGTLPAEITLQGKLGLYNDGTFAAVADGEGALLLFAADGSGYSTPVVFSASQQEVRVLTDASEVEHFLTIPFSLNTTFFHNSDIGLSMASITGVSWSPNEYFNDDAGAIWAVGRARFGTVTTCYFYRIVRGDGSTGPDFVTVTGLGGSGSLGLSTAVFHDGYFILCWANNSLHKIDPSDGSIVASRSVVLDAFNTAKQFANHPAGQATIWLDNVEYSLIDLSTVRTLDLSHWNSASKDGILYEPVNHALWTFPQFEQEMNILYLDRVSAEGVTLGEIESDVAATVGVEDHDFSAHTQVIKGWSATQGQASNVVEPLHAVHDCTIRPHNFTIQGINYSGISGGTILTERFVKAAPRYSAKVRQAAELPAQIVVNFADINGDQQPNNVLSPRAGDITQAKGVQTLDMTTWAEDADAARGYVDRYFRRMWNERREVSQALTAQELALEPGDCRTLSLDGAAATFRCTILKVRADDTLAPEWKYDHASLALLDAALGAEFDGRAPSSIQVPLISRAFAIDGPYLADADAQTPPILYGLAAPYGEGSWPGAVMYRAIDGEYSDELASFTTGQKATWGQIDEAFAYTNPNIWDRGTVLTVRLKTGTLTGASEAAIDANRMLNLAAIGAQGRWEYVQFAAATLVAANVYELSGFKRGRRGTEWASGLHVAGDSFVLLDAAETMDIGLSDVGADQSLKAVTSGRTEAGTFPVAVAPFTGASLKPYAPCRLRGLRDFSSNDWTLSWVRRTRLGGDWVGGASFPVSEVAEEYEVEIMNGGTVVRTVTGLSSPAYTYSSANQVSDFGSNQAAITFRVYQISDAVGRGFVATATV